MPPSKRLEWSVRAEQEYLKALAFVAAVGGARNDYEVRYGKED